MIIRILDIIFSLIGLFLLSPIFILVSFILKLNNESVFYLQQRVGENNKKFKVIKFTTMLSNSSKMSFRNITLRNDPRVTKFGKILRISKINELPQLFNVIKGDMSIVGPRPLPLKSFRKYSEEGQSIIAKLKPGITGISSIIFRDEEAIATEWKKNDLNVEDMYRDKLYPYKEKLEKWYFQNRSFKLYFYLIFLTSYSIFADPKNLLSYLFKDLPLSKYFYNNDTTIGSKPFRKRT